MPEKLPFACVSHMHMIEDNPAPQLAGKATNLTVMEVMLKWADMNVSKPEVTGQAKEEMKMPRQMAGR